VKENMKSWWSTIFQGETVTTFSQNNVKIKGKRAKMRIFNFLGGGGRNRKKLNQKLM